MPEIDSFREMMSEDQYHVSNEMGRQEKFEARMVEKVLRAGGATPGYIAGVKRDNNATFDWFNQNAEFPTKFSAKRLGREAAFDELITWVHRGRAKDRVEVRHLRDLIEAYGADARVGLVLRYQDFGYEVVVYTGPIFDHGNNAVTVVSLPDFEFAIQRFDLYLAQAVASYNWRIEYDR